MMTAKMHVCIVSERNVEVRRHPYRSLLLLALFVLLAVSLARYSQSAPGVGAPVININPVSGGPETPVTVAGAGFPAQLEVNVRLGPPDVGATPQSYARVMTDRDGQFVLVFSMPDRWPDGTPITERNLVVVVLNEDGSVKATAPFRYDFTRLHNTNDPTPQQKTASRTP